MKTFRKIGMALFAVFMCVNFMSCDKDADDDELSQYEIVTSGKRVAKIEISDSYTGYSVWEFKYDNSGKLHEIIHNDDMITNYVWSKNTINAYTISEGLISNYNGNSEVVYSYSNGRAYQIKSSSSYSYEYTFVWGNEGLKRRDIHYRQENTSRIQESFSFIYDEDSTTCNNFNPIFPIFLSVAFNGDLLCVAHPELVAARSTRLPSRFTEDYYRWYDKGYSREEIRGICNYKFDSDGYLTECIMNENSTDYYSYKATYTITWE